jgi:hypothetical protein
MAWKKVPGYGYPPAAKFVANWYAINGWCMDCTEEQRTSFVGEVLAKIIGEMSSAPNAPNGALQITPVTSATPTPIDTMVGCAANANALAVSDPAWSKRVGHDGLIKIYMACDAESRGMNAPGFTQEVTTLLTKSPGASGGVDKRLIWLAAGFAAIILLRK